MNRVSAVIVLVCCWYAHVCLGLPYTPPYTYNLARNEYAVSEVKKHLFQHNSYDSKDSELHYLMILNAINHVIDFYAHEPTIGRDYYDVVSNAIQETINDPHAASDKVRTQLDITSSKVAMIKDLIKDKQEHDCADNESRACDVLIDLAVTTSRDILLKKQASLFETLAVEVNLFLDDFLHEFQETAHARNAQAYLLNGKEHLDPLLQAGAKVRRESKNIPLLLRRSYGGQITWA